METQKALLKDEDGKEVDVLLYRYQVNQKVSHLHDVKRIFRFILKRLIIMPGKKPDISGANSTTEAEFVVELQVAVDKVKTINKEAQLHALVDGKKITITESSVRRDLQLMRLSIRSWVRAATTASSLEAEQDNGNINKTRSKATPNESSSLGTTSGGGARCQETTGDTIAQTRFENVSKHFNDSLLARGNTLRSDEDRLKLDELMALCTTLQNRVLDLEKTKTSQHNEIVSLKRRAKKLEKKNRSRTHKLKILYKVGLRARVESSNDEESLGEDASKQERIDAIDADEEITLVSAIGDKVSAASAATTISAATTTTATTVNDITLAQALEEMKSTKPKMKGAKIDADHQLAERLQAQEQEELSIEEKATLF
ncbi:hypothetical protein Tco_1030276 [Tanacetum coccineum]|uniref:Uncharacterized protein n=1 Tax=Tanacetum coccineum TaxID=301880 RepID=A0ABQ5G662_9ASTR